MESNNFLFKKTFLMIAVVAKYFEYAISLIFKFVLC